MLRLLEEIELFVVGNGRVRPSGHVLVASIIVGDDATKRFGQRARGVSRRSSDLRWRVCDIETANVPVPSGVRHIAGIVQRDEDPFESFADPGRRGPSCAEAEDISYRLSKAARGLVVPVISRIDWQEDECRDYGIGLSDVVVSCFRASFAGDAGKLV